MAALGTWGERWIELAPEHLDAGLVLHDQPLAHDQPHEVAPLFRAWHGPPNPAKTVLDCGEDMSCPFLVR